MFYTLLSVCFAMLSVYADVSAKSTFELLRNYFGNLQSNKHSNLAYFSII